MIFPSVQSDPTSDLTSDPTSDPGSKGLLVDFRLLHCPPGLFAFVFVFAVLSLSRGRNELRRDLDSELQ